MKAISTRMVRCLQVGSVLKCADNAGPKEIRVISVMKYSGKRRTRPSCGVASKITCSAVSGNEKTMHMVLKAVIIRQKKEYRRPSGMHISFEDNAAIIVNDNWEPQGTIIKGPVAKEVAERFPIIGKSASFIV